MKYKYYNYIDNYGQVNYVRMYEFELDVKNNVECIELWACGSWSYLKGPVSIYEFEKRYDVKLEPKTEDDFNSYLVMKELVEDRELDLWAKWEVVVPMKIMPHIHIDSITYIHKVNVEGDSDVE